MQLLSVLLASEEEIKTRSKAVESHWSPDKYQDKSSGEKMLLHATVTAMMPSYNSCTCTPNTAATCMLSGGTSTRFGKSLYTHVQVYRHPKIFHFLFLIKNSTSILKIALSTISIVIN